MQLLPASCAVSSSKRSIHKVTWQKLGRWGMLISMLIRLSLLVVTVVLLTACSRARVTTEVRSGGAFTRAVSLTGQDKEDKKDAQASGSLGDAIEDVFVLPAGEEWKTHTEKAEANLTKTFERTFASGAMVKGDLTIKGVQNSVLLVNDVVVKRLAPNRYEYRETLRWTGPPQDDMTQMKTEDLTKLKAALPPALATDENARALAKKVGDLTLPMFFGPGDPLFTIGFFHPDLAGRRLSQKIGGVMMKALEEQFGDKMTVAQRREITLRLIESSVGQSKQMAPNPSAGPPAPSQSSALTPLLFVVKTPGKIEASNGEVDELTGEVFWGLYPPAALLKPVVMTATVRVD